ncbi:hypothetical protein NLG97_g5881 [Lecanicillium saksenae]|uniref:Uncharacterized protein n=1 Tax=Lecanicillium saksenae TaxID=468837 RepID=A0ACC1QTR8_9HYPO|nr:hypothetical protein NLG97_g5881 [Lecanicillium saksenae]
MDVDKWLGSITLYEAVQIWTRFSETCEPRSVVFWSGIKFDQAQAWAARHGRKTLTLAMGPLMDKEHTCCRYHLKNIQQWCRYVHAASILLALFASNGTEVVVLTPHPPQRLNPYGESYYQNIEQPWLTACCDATNFRIQFAHPDIEEAKDDVYQYWPVDCVDGWTTKHPGAKAAYHWHRHSWDKVQMSHYSPDDLRRERCNVMQKMYLYRTGASIYWRVAVSVRLLHEVAARRSCSYINQTGTKLPANITAAAKQQRLQRRREKKRRRKLELTGMAPAEETARKAEKRRARKQRCNAQVKQADEESKRAAETQREAKLRKKQQNREENRKREEANKKRREENKRRAEEQRRKADEERKKKAERMERLNEKKRRAREKKRRAEEERRRQQQQQQSAETGTTDMRQDSAITPKKQKKQKKQKKKKSSRTEAEAPKRLLLEAPQSAAELSSKEGKRRKSRHVQKVASGKKKTPTASVVEAPAPAPTKMVTRSQTAAKARKSC